jgi:hypothetical protein
MLPWTLFELTPGASTRFRRRCRHMSSVRHLQDLNFNHRSAVSCIQGSKQSHASKKAVYHIQYSTEPPRGILLVQAYTRLPSSIFISKCRKLRPSKQIVTVISQPVSEQASHPLVGPHRELCHCSFTCTCNVSARVRNGHTSLGNLSNSL